MSANTPKKPDQEWLDAILENYYYVRYYGEVASKKNGNIQKGISSNQYRVFQAWSNGKKKTFQLHHVIWFFEHGEWPTQGIDHINGNKTDNRHTNLRQCTTRENIQFYHTSRKTSSKYMGVSFYAPQSKWSVVVGNKGKTQYIGRYACEKDAARAYDAALVKIGLAPFNQNMYTDL